MWVLNNMTWDIWADIMNLVSMIWKNSPDIGHIGIPSVETIWTYIFFMFTLTLCERLKKINDPDVGHIGIHDRPLLVYKAFHTALTLQAGLRHSDIADSISPAQCMKGLFHHKCYLSPSPSTCSAAKSRESLQYKRDEKHSWTNSTVVELK